MEIKEIFFVLTFVLFLGIFILFVTNIFYKGELFDFKQGGILLILYLLSYLVNFIAFMTYYADVTIFEVMLFNMLNFFFYFGIFLFIIQIFIWFSGVFTGRQRYKSEE